MAIVLPGRHPAFHPIGRLRKNPFKGGKKSLMMPLNLTAMVDMFTVIVIFLLQSFSASGEVMFMQKDLKLPSALQSIPLEERGPVITLFRNQVLVEGEVLAELESRTPNDPNIPDVAAEDPGVEALQTRLTAIRQKEDEIKKRTGRKTAEEEGKAYDGHAIVQADKATDFELVRKAIFSINGAGWTHLQFAVMPVVAPAPAEGEAQ